MKKSLMLCMFMVLSLIAVGCMEDGDDGATGSSGAPGQDALISSNPYTFTPVGNPYTEVIAEIDLTGVEAGWQTVTVYEAYASGEWQEMPTSYDIAGVQYEDVVTVGNGFVKIETLAGGVNAGGDACLGAGCMAIVQTFNH